MLTALLQSQTLAAPSFLSLTAVAFLDALGSPLCVEGPLSGFRLCLRRTRLHNIHVDCGCGSPCFLALCPSGSPVLFWCVVVTAGLSSVCRTAALHGLALGSVVRSISPAHCFQLRFRESFGCSTGFLLVFKNN